MLLENSAVEWLGKGRAHLNEGELPSAQRADTCTGKGMGLGISRTLLFLDPRSTDKGPRVMGGAALDDMLMWYTNSPSCSKQGKGATR
eukprot:1157628-Pelagomonas_calceolata.AAC.10